MALTDQASTVPGIPLSDFLRRVKADGKPGDWMGHCPAHDDKTASLHVTLSGNKVLVHCFVCGGGDSFIDQFKQQGLWPITVTADQVKFAAVAAPREEVRENLTTTDEKPPHPPVPDGYQPAMRHEYRTREGHLLGTVSRFEELMPPGKVGKPLKKFIPTFYFQTDKGPAWLFRAPAIKPLYNLRSLNSPGPVIIVEGEKTCDAAEKVFTSNPVISPMGGMHGFGTSDLTPLRGRDVIIWPDADPTWKENADRWATALGSIPHSIKIVHLPAGLVQQYPKWDLADPLPEYVQRVHRLLSDARDWLGGINAAVTCVTKGEDLREFFVKVKVTPASNDFVHVGTGEEFSESSFNGHFKQFTKHRFSQLPADYLIDGPDKVMRMMLGYCYQPGKSLIFVDTTKNKRLYNKWMPPIIKPREGDCSVFLEHLEWLLNEQDRKELLCRLASLVQSPWRKPSSVYVMQGIQGVGKNLIFNTFDVIVGQKNYQVTEPEIIMSGFNSLIAFKTMVIINEFTDFNKHEFLEKIKGTIADPTMTVNQKYRDAYTIENYIHFFALTNQERPVYLVDDDRRFYVAKCVPEVPRSASYYTKLASWMIENPDILMHYLQHYNIGDWNEKAIPVLTEAKKTIIALSRPRSSRNLIDLLDESKKTGAPFKYSVYTRAEFLQTLKANNVLLDGNLQRTVDFLTQKCGCLCFNAPYSYKIPSSGKTIVKQRSFIVLHPEILGDTPEQQEVNKLRVGTLYEEERKGQPDLTPGPEDDLL